MAVSDPMPTDKRTVAYKQWLKRDKYRQRMQELEGSVSVRGFSYDDRQMYSDLSIELATLKANLLKKYPPTVDVMVDKGVEYLSGRGLNFVISAPTKFVNDFKNWAMRNHYSDYRSAQYPSFTQNQYKIFEEDLSKKESKIESSNLMEKTKVFFKKNGLLLNWSEFEKLDQVQKINTLAMISPITIEEKQKLLETISLKEKATTLENIINFYLHEVNFNNLTVQ